MENILAVLVLYKTKIEDSPTFISLNEALVDSGKFLDIYIYDNSPESYLKDGEWSYGNMRINYVNDTLNSGISKAYNAGAKIALAKGKKFLLLLDQDSQFPKNYFDILQAMCAKFPTHKMFVPILKEKDLILSPCKFKFKKGSALRSVKCGALSLDGLSVFNSGLMINLKAFINIGGYSEKIRLDFADHYFVGCFKQLYKECVVLPITVGHSLSSFDLNRERQKRRFSIYCQGTRNYVSVEGGYFQLLLWNFLRALKLSVLLKDVNFIKILIYNYILIKDAKD